MKPALSAILLTLLAVGCSAELSSNLTVNEQAWKPSGCRSGAAYGYRGVAFEGPDGLGLRIEATMTGEANVAVLHNGEVPGTALGKCGTIVVNDQSSTINDIKNVEGKATLDCTGDGIHITGSVTFGNCH